MGLYADRVRETTTTTGTGAVTLGGAVTGYQSWSTAFGSYPGPVYYCITDGTNWETGRGHLSSGTLVRDQVIESSNSGSLVSFGAGSKDVFCTLPGRNVVDLGIACAIDMNLVAQ